MSSPAPGGPDSRQAFVASLPFPLDPFQSEALDALDAGRSLLVSAPTGSGKTLIAAYAVHRAIHGGGKAFYTTPLKALSNQKFGELIATYGEAKVGLLTGDTAVRPDAPVVVMTTEVLRNMLLARSTLLTGLAAVVLDEVHYLQDPYRGGVWEEVLVLSPPEVVFVCLSATVANAAELGAWLRSVRGPTDVVLERRRPVTLRHHVAVRRREDHVTLLLPLLVNGQTGPEGARIDQAVRRASDMPRPPQWRNGRSGGRSAGRGRGPGGPPGLPLPYRSPRRTEVIELLDDHEMLPAIVFIFSRAGCDEAVRQCLRDGLRLTDHHERAAIRQIVEDRTTGLSDDDLAVLGYPEWLEGLEAGITSHHAGLVPAYREAVEACFEAGLLRVVFATETLSLGINMPARSVVIERFTKFGSAGRATLTSGEYAQLTGRAGRRGLDLEGNAVVLWSPEITVAEVARVAVAPPPNLRSAFRPTYNLAVNLVRRFDRAQAVQILRSSFAQWQATHQRTTVPQDTLVEHLNRRLAVLEELGYTRGWSLQPSGDLLARIYHESDLLVAEAVVGEALSGAEPAVLAGVLSALVFERRRARRVQGHGGRGGKDRSRESREGPVRKRVHSDRLGEQRRAELAERTAMLAEASERVRAIEELYLAPRTRVPEPGLGGAVCAWARGASFGTVLEVAARDVGEIAPGDFVRTVKQVADLVDQVSAIAPDPATAAAANSAVRLLLRDVVAAGVPMASPPAEVAQP